MIRFAFVAVAIAVIATTCAVEEVTTVPSAPDATDVSTTLASDDDAEPPGGTMSTDATDADAVADPDQQSADEGESVEQDESPTTKTPETVPPAEGVASVSEVPASILNPIADDAAVKSGASRDEIAVLRAESVVWNDGSLGCPEPGVTYTDAPVDGYWVELDAAGEKFDYRATASGYFRRCTGPVLQPPTG